MKAKLFFFYLLALLVGACARQPATPPPTPLPSPTPLPTAVPPSGDASEPGTNGSRDWAISFSHVFPAEFWDVGNHRYGFRIQCTELDYDLAGEWRRFSVTEQITRQPFPLYLRMGGLSANEFALTYFSDARIHPAQETIGIVHLVGLSEEAAKIAANNCEVLMGWDQGGVQRLEPQEPFTR